MDWKEEIINKIRIKNMVSKMVTDAITESTTELIEALNENKILCDVKAIGTKISIGGNCTIEFTADTISNLMGKAVGDITPNDIKDVIHEHMRIIL